MASCSLVAGMSRREKIAWATFFACWIGMNVVLIYGPDWWMFLFDPRFQSSWQARFSYRPGKWTVPDGEAGAGRSLKYRVLESATSKSPQPLLIFLHGAGARGEDNLQQLNGLPSQLVESEWRTICPGFVIAPQCPANSHWLAEMPVLISLIDAWRNDPRVDKRRIYLTGLSMGGYGTWQLAATKPEWFAAVAPICGGGDPSTAAKLISVPIWAVHGDADQVVPVEETRRMIKAIRAVGGEPQYSELPGFGHDSWTATYRDPSGVLQWIHNTINMRARDIL